MLELDLTPVWEALTKENVVLLVDTHFVPDTCSPSPVSYDSDVFDEKLAAVHNWFLPLISENLSTMDFKLQNNAILSVRPLLPLPFAQKSETKVMVLR